MVFPVSYEGAASIATCLFLALGFPLLLAVGPSETQFYSRQFLEDRYPFTFLAILLGTLGALFFRTHKDRHDDQIDTKRGITESSSKASSVEQLLSQIKKFESEVVSNTRLDKSIEDEIVRCLNTLANNCSRRHAAATEMNDDDAMELFSQETAFIALRTFSSSSDAILSAALSVLAPIAGNVKVRERTRTDAEMYGIHIPISRIQTSLREAKNAMDEQQEHLSAQVQMKGCLFLGAMADGDTALARNIIDDNGLEIMLDACDWYRLHCDVAKWSLWAIFVLCYDHPGNKTLLIQMDGLRRICQILREITDNVDVTRHGIAILFDSMRENGISE
jgi:hypothetical protein